MSKTTYYFGAGASKGALPIVDEIPKRIKNVISKLEVYANDFDSDEVISINSIDWENHSFEVEVPYRISCLLRIQSQQVFEVPSNVQIKNLRVFEL